MNTSKETKVQSLEKNKKFPEEKLLLYRQEIKDNAKDLVFYKTVKTFRDDTAILSYDNNPLCVGYHVEEDKNRVICLKNDKDYGLFQRMRRVPSNRFEEVKFSEEELLQLVASLHNEYNKAEGDNLETSILIAIAWCSEILKREYDKEYSPERKEVRYSFPKMDAKEKESLVKEMIGKIDLKRFMKMLSVAGSTNSRNKYADKKVAEEILQDWANAKVGFYKLFNKNFFVKEEVEMEIGTEDVEAMRRELCKKYPPYSFALKATEISDWISNSMNNSFDYHSNWAEIQGVKKGMKLSKAFSTLYKDDAFDIAISEVLQNRKIKGGIFVSIDPYDYLTSSVNKSGWTSCHRLTDGEYATGCSSYMCDAVTLMGYRATDVEYDYNFFGFDFVGNSKLWRTNVIFDLSNMSFAIGRQYPKRNTDIETVAKDLLIKTIREYFGDIKFSYVEDNFKNNISDFCSLHYNDFINTSEKKYLFFPSETNGAISFVVGSPVKCVYCGGEIENPRGAISHGECLQKK